MKELDVPEVTAIYWDHETSPMAYGIHSHKISFCIFFIPKEGRLVPGEGIEPPSTAYKTAALTTLPPRISLTLQEDQHLTKCISPD